MFELPDGMLDDPELAEIAERLPGAPRRSSSGAGSAPRVAPAPSCRAGRPRPPTCRRSAPACSPSTASTSTASSPWPRPSSRSWTDSPEPSTSRARALPRRPRARRAVGARAGGAARARGRARARPRPASLRARRDRGGRPRRRGGARALGRARAPSPRRGPARRRGGRPGRRRRRRDGRRRRRAPRCGRGGAAAVEGVDPRLDALAERAGALGVELRDLAERAALVPGRHRRRARASAAGGGAARGTRPAEAKARRLASRRSSPTPSAAAPRSTGWRAPGSSPAARGAARQVGEASRTRRCPGQGAGRKAAGPLSEQVAEELEQLAMEGATLEVALEPHPDGFGAAGSRAVELRVATNPGLPTVAASRCGLGRRALAGDAGAHPARAGRRGGDARLRRDRRRDRRQYGARGGGAAARAGRRAPGDLHHPPPAGRLAGRARTSGSTKRVEGGDGDRRGRARRRRRAGRRDRPHDRRRPRRRRRRAATPASCSKRRSSR